MDNTIKALVKDVSESTNEAIQNNKTETLYIDTRLNTFYNCRQIHFKVPSKYIKGFVSFTYNNSGKERSVFFNDWIELEGDIDKRLGKTFLVIEETI